MKIKSCLSNVLLLLTAVVISFVLLEIGFRILLFGDNPNFDRLRVADNYADYFSDDDYYKLLYRFNGKVFENPHSLLGWIGNFSGDTYLHHELESVQGRRPVLLYGDSFAARTYFHDYLNSNEEFSKDHYLLNYGVGGYGVGQIFLLFQNSVHLYDDPLVVVSLMTLDLDRTLLSVRGGAKPYFQIDNETLQLRGVPISPDSDDHYANHPPQITSYIYRRLLYGYFPAKFVSYLRPDVERITEKKAVNEKVILEIVNELRDHDLDFVFLVFHPHWPGVSTLDNENDWRDPFLKGILEKHNVPYIWSKAIFQQDTKNKQFLFSDYIVPEDGHPTSYFNQLIAAEIKRYVLETSLN